MVALDSVEAVFRILNIKIYKSLTAMQVDDTLRHGYFGHKEKHNDSECC
jgi:hypothetical protein